jgi:lipopolysaccharide transport system ATP-binding protein
LATPVITVNNLGKLYRLGFHHGHDTLRDRIAYGFRDLLKNRSAGHVNKRSSEKYFWALREISFELNQGEVLGIIGRNGAGKTTLLKVLSRITKPSEGGARIRGRVTSLLEVGTGFHPELSGRENIYLNGAVLGMSKNEIAGKFDEIVAFAEVDKFIDTPVKRYSSGMYVRLAFAVAAHINAEIMVIDEVLAVGDLEFQKKCLGKMGDVSKSGRTILFVSHNMGAVQQLCDKVMLLREGQKCFEGNTQEGISIYLRKSSKLINNSADVDVTDYPDRDSHHGIAKLRRITLRNSERVVTNEFRMGDEIDIEIQVDLSDKLRDPIFDVVITNELGQYISVIRSDWCGFHYYDSVGTIKVNCKIRRIILTPGLYYISAEITRSLLEGACLDMVHLPISFRVTSSDITGFGAYSNWNPQSTYCLHLDSEWQISN